MKRREFIKKTLELGLVGVLPFYSNAVACMNPYIAGISVIVSGNPYAIFGYGSTGSYVSMTNLVSNVGVVAADVTGVGTARYGLAAASFG